MLARISKKKKLTHNNVTLFMLILPTAALSGSLNIKVGIIFCTIESLENLW